MFCLVSIVGCCYTGVKQKELAAKQQEWLKEVFLSGRCTGHHSSPYHHRQRRLVHRSPASAGDGGARGPRRGHRLHGEHAGGEEGDDSHEERAAGEKLTFLSRKLTSLSIKLTFLNVQAYQVELNR